MLSKRLASKLVLLLWYALEVCSWSLFATKSPASPSSSSSPLLAARGLPSVAPPVAAAAAAAADSDRVEQAQTLLQHLKHGQSQFHPGITVVSVGEGGEECGIKLQQKQTGGMNGVGQPTRNNGETSDDVIFVDRKEFVTPQSGLETSVGQALQWHLSQNGNSVHANSDKLPHIYLAIYLTLYKQGLLELEPHSVMADYLKTLPSSLEHLPVFWHDDMLEELQCSVLRQGVKSRREEWKQELVLIQTALREVGLTRLMKDALSLDTWYWARSIITSRAFVDSGNHDQPCLCPYVDMMNHITSLQSEDTNEAVQCTWDIDSQGYHLRIPQIAEEDPTISNANDAATSHPSATTGSTRLEISYGKHSNAQFLMNYGFSILDDEEHTGEDIATLPLLLPHSVQEVETQSLWEADGLGDCHSVARNVTVGIGNAGPMESVLSLCRVASAQQPELSRMKENFLERDQRTDQCEDGLVPQMGATLCRTPFSVPNEIRALHMLREATQTALGRYPTTMEQDSNMLLTGSHHRDDHEEQMISSSRTRASPVSWLRSLWKKTQLSHGVDAENSGSLEFQWRNAVTVRREEKKILLHYFQLASIGLNFLERIESEDDDDNDNDNDIDSSEFFETYKGMLEASLQDQEPLLVM